MKTHLISRLISVGAMLALSGHISQAQTPANGSVGMEKLPPLGKYYLVHCGFISSPDNKYTWWTCNLYPPEFLTAGTTEKVEQLRKAMINMPALWLLPVEEDGSLGNSYEVRVSLKASLTYYGSSIAALGNQNNLFINLSKDDQTFPIIAMLKMSSILKNSPQQLQESLFYQFAQPEYRIVQTIAMKEGGYGVLLHGDIPADPMRQNNRFILVKLSNKGKELWRYAYHLPISDERQPEEQIFSTVDDKMVVFWANYDEFNYDEQDEPVGTRVLCIDKNGHEITNTVIPGEPIDNYVTLKNGEFGFIRHGHNKTLDKIDSSFLHFNTDCKEIREKVFKIPNHTSSDQFYNVIKAIVMLPNEHLLVGYIQEEDGKGPYPDVSLYLAEFDDNMNVVQDIEVIGEENPDRKYLISVPDSNGKDPFYMTFALLPQKSEVLVSIHNARMDMEYDGEEGAEKLLSNLYMMPKIYRVKITLPN